MSYMTSYFLAISWLFDSKLIQSAVHFGDPKYMPGRRSVDGELRKMAASQHSEVWELDTFETQPKAGNG